MQRHHGAAERAVKQMGISFAVYSEAGNIDRAWPFDIIPRLIAHAEWQQVSLGLAQRTKALNRFINDVYNGQQIFKAGIVPEKLVVDSPNYRPECENVVPKHGAWAHICGTDLVRDHHGRFLVLEDNLRVPSGVSYMIENRELSKRVVPELFANHSVLPVDDYAGQLYKTLVSISPSDRKRPCIVVLTPGIFNSAYFEHAYLAKEMGAELVEGSDLVVDNHYVFMKTAGGLKTVDVIYRRIDDDFLDPLNFKVDSVLGVAGIMDSFRQGNVILINCPGAGIADDKAIYTYVPDMISYYLNEEPILENIKTYKLTNKDEKEYVLKNIDKLVLKRTDGSGGYGMLMGKSATKEEINKYKLKIKKEPEMYIAQPTLNLSTSPCLIDNSLHPRCVDLRPFALFGSDGIEVCPGGLSRIALKKGSLVVNSSQGGGSKDTWIVKN